MFIGMELLTQQNIVRVPHDRVSSLLLTIKLFLSQTQVTARTFLSLLGKLSAAADVCSPRQTTLTSASNVSFICLETSHSSSRSLHSDKQHDLIPLGMVDGHQSLRLGNVHSSSGTQYIPFHRCQSFWMGSSSRSDASHFGWGAHLDLMRLYFHGHWLEDRLEDQSQLHINILEMMAICLALKKAIKYIHHSCVMISTDNTTVVSYINKLGGTHSPNLCVEVWKILHWCLEYDIVIKVRHIPGKFNILVFQDWTGLSKQNEL